MAVDTNVEMNLTNAQSYIGPCIQGYGAAKPDNDPYFGKKFSLVGGNMGTAGTAVRIDFLKDRGLLFPNDPALQTYVWNRTKVQICIRPAGISSDLKPAGGQFPVTYPPPSETANPNTPWASPRNFIITARPNSAWDWGPDDFTVPGCYTNARTQLRANQSLYLDFDTTRLFGGIRPPHGPSVPVAAFQVETDCADGEVFQLQMIIRGFTRQIVQFE